MLVLNTTVVSINDLYGTGIRRLKPHMMEATLDDYIADFHRLVTENGRYRLSFIITAPTRQSFQGAWRFTGNAHRGAGSNNNVTLRTDQLTLRPEKTESKSTTAVEWVPFYNRTKMTSRTYLSRLIGGLRRHLACRDAERH